MSRALRVPGRALSLDRLAPGTCYLMAGSEGPDLALTVTREGRRDALLLNRRGGAGRDLPVRSDLAPDTDVLDLRGAFIAPSGAVDDIAFDRTTIVPAALHLGEANAYLCGRDESGRRATFDVGTGAASAIDPADLPYSRRWRVMVSEPGGGVVTVYEAVPA